MKLMHQPPSALQTAPAAPPREAPPMPPRRSSSRFWVWLIAVLVLGAAAYYFWPKTVAPQDSAGAGKGKGRGKGGANPNVVGARATKGDIGVYINGLGAVTP